MQNTYEQWLKSQSIQAQIQQTDPLNTSQNWLNSSINLPPEQRLNALNDLVSRIVEDKPKNESVEEPPPVLLEPQMPILQPIPFQFLNHYQPQINLIPNRPIFFFPPAPPPLPMFIPPSFNMSILNNELIHLTRPNFRQHRRTGSANELHIRLEESSYQLKCLEVEQKNFEDKLFRDKKSQIYEQNDNFRLPQNPSRVDRHIIDQLRECSKIQNLLNKYTNQINFQFNTNLMNSLEKWFKSIKNVQQKRQNEILNATKRSQLGQQRFIDDNDVMELANSINELQSSTAKMRTSLWCMSQIVSKIIKQ